MVLLRPFIKIENLVVLAKTITIKIAIRIIKKRALGIERNKIRLALYCLAKGSRILKRKSLFREGIACLHPGTLLAATCSTMSLIHQHQIVILKCVDGDGLLFGLFTKLGHLKNLDRMARKQTSTILAEQLGLNACRIKFPEVLL